MGNLVDRGGQSELVSVTPLYPDGFEWGSGCRGRFNCRKFQIVVNIAKLRTVTAKSRPLIHGRLVVIWP
jgi:hypothetical protein